MQGRKEYLNLFFMLSKIASGGGGCCCCIIYILCLQPAKIYKLKHLSKVEVVTNDPSGCTFTLVMLHFPILKFVFKCLSFSLFFFGC